MARPMTAVSAWFYDLGDELLVKMDRQLSAAKSFNRQKQSGWAATSCCGEGAYDFTNP